VTARALVAVAHGTRSPVGRAQVRDLVARVAGRRPDLDTRLCYVDVQTPRVGPAMAALGGPAVVVPLLLTAGYHVGVDIAAATAGLDAVTAPALGAGGALLEILTDHLASAGRADAVILAAAGSTAPQWQAEVASVASSLPLPATVAYAATCQPGVAAEVALLRRAGADRVVVLAYLLADGRFYRSLHRTGADAVTPPLAMHPATVDVVLARHDHAGAALTW